MHIFKFTGDCNKFKVVNDNEAFTLKISMESMDVICLISKRHDSDYSFNIFNVSNPRPNRMCSCSELLVSENLIRYNTCYCVHLKTMRHAHSSNSNKYVLCYILSCIAGIFSGER